MTFMAFVFPMLPTAKTWLDKGPKSLVSEDSSTSNMVNVLKHCSNLIKITFNIFLIVSKSVELEKFSLIDMPNLGTAF